VPNLYDVSGGGAVYPYEGFALVSRHSRFAFVVGGIDQDITTNGITVRSVVGGFNSKKSVGNTVGWQQPGGLLTNHVGFVAAKTPVPVGGGQ
jgi:hypothetical protein